MPDPNQDSLLGRDVGAETQDETDLNSPVEWAGLPAFHPAPKREIQIVISCDTEEARDEAIAKLALVIAKKTGKTWSAWYPPRDREDLASLRFDFGPED